MKVIKCKKCGEEFDPNHPNNKGGYINVCGACENKADDEKQKVRGFRNLTEEGDYASLTFVDAETFKKLEEAKGHNLKNDFKRNKK